VEDIVATIIVVIIAWLIYLLSAVLLSLPLWFLGRKRAQFRWWELSALVVPFIIWLACFELLSRNKSLGNIVEASILGGAIPLGVLIRVMIGGRLNRSVVATGLMGLVCVFAVLLAVMFPEVPFRWFH
jgi:hypothetical protein